MAATSTPIPAWPRAAMTRRCWRLAAQSDWCAGVACKPGAQRHCGCVRRDIIARANRGMGFCLFNNVAIAAMAALWNPAVTGADHRLGRAPRQRHAGHFLRLAPGALLLHTQFPYYPGSGGFREVGAGAGQGYTINVPLPAGVGDRGFARVYGELLTAAAERFRPDLILISAGYDARWDDPLAGLRLSLGGYWGLAQTVVALADRSSAGRLVVTLEGGYNLEVLSPASRTPAGRCSATLSRARIPWVPQPDGTRRDRFAEGCW